MTHTIDEAIQIIEAIPPRKLLAPYRRRYYAGDPLHPSQCCPLWYVALAWGLVGEATGWGLTGYKSARILDGVVDAMNAPLDTAFLLTGAYDVSPSKKAGIAAVVTRLQAMKTASGQDSGTGG